MPADLSPGDRAGWYVVKLNPDWSRELAEETRYDAGNQASARASELGDYHYPMRWDGTAWVEHTPAPDYGGLRRVYASWRREEAVFIKGRGKERWRGLADALRLSAARADGPGGGEMVLVPIHPTTAMKAAAGAWGFDCAHDVWQAMVRAALSPVMVEGGLGTSSANGAARGLTADADQQLGASLEDGNRLPLSSWLSEVAILAGYESGPAMVADTGTCAWMDSYNAGLTPAEAWAEDCDNG